MKTRMYSMVAILAVAGMLAIAPRAARAACTGDCNGDGSVTVDEIVTMVNLALNGGTTGCTAGDSNGDGTITVDEIVTAVNNALNGCVGGTCGDGAVNVAGEECDDGGTCIGGTNAGTHCTAESQCQGNGVCIGGSKAETACAAAGDCPGGSCVHCVPQGGDGCAANCTNETQIVVNLKPGVLNGTTLTPGTSGAVVYNEVLGPISLPFQQGTKETVVLGKDRGDGVVPAVVLATSVTFPKIDVQGLACACVRGVAAKTCGGTLFKADGSAAVDCTPGFTAGDGVCTGGEPPCTFVHGEGAAGSGGNSASGEIDCNAGLQGVDLLFTQDSTPAAGLPEPTKCDPNSQDFVPGSTFPDCGKPPVIALSGTGPAGSSVLLNTTAIGQAIGPCSSQGATYCTDTDPFSARGTPATLPSVTDIAAGEMFNINSTAGDTLCNCPAGLNSCDISQCITDATHPNGAISVTGSPLPSCSQLTASPPNVTGLGLAGSFTSLSNATIGDIVVTNLLQAE